MIRLVVDSTFGLPREFVLKNKIEVVSLKMLLGEEVFEEGFEDSWPAFYEKMHSSKIFPTTSQPSPQDFMDAVDRIFAEDANAQIIILTISNGLSGTINAATIAANSYDGKKVLAVDSRQATSCGRLMVEELLEAINAGQTLEQVLALISLLQKKLKIQFVPNTMEALKRGGRISGLGATIAGILKIKPVFKFEDGKISVVKKVLGLSRAIHDAVLALPQKLKKLYVCYINDKLNVPLINQKLQTLRGINNAEALAVDPVFGVHVGIGAIGLASLEEY